LDSRLVKSRIATGAQHHHIGDIARRQHADTHPHHHAVTCGRRAAPLLADIAADYIIIAGRHLIADLISLSPLILGFFGQQVCQGTGTGLLLFALQPGYALGFRPGFGFLLAFGFIRSTTPCFFLTLARLLGCLAPGLFLGGFLFRLFLGQFPGGLRPARLLGLLPFDLFGLPSFLGCFFCRRRARRPASRFALCGLALLFTGAGGLLFLLPLLLFPGQLLGLVSLSSRALSLAGNTLLGLRGGRALGIELHQ